MKFVCNNCGFTAEIPVRRDSCPMCGSSNVSASAETANPPEETHESGETNLKTRNSRAVEGPTQRVTMTEGLDGGGKMKNVSKSDKKVCGKSSCRCKIPVIIALLLLAAAAAAFFFLKYL